MGIYRGDRTGESDLAHAIYIYWPHNSLLLVWIIARCYTAVEDFVDFHATHVQQRPFHKYA